MNSNQLLYDKSVEEIMAPVDDDEQQDSVLEIVPPASEDAGLLESRHVDELKGSGLSWESITAAGIRSVSAKEAEKLVGVPCGTGWAVPYYGLKGEPPMWQVKPDSPFEFSDGRKAKYLWGKGQPNRIYVPHSIRNVLSNPKIALTITEGVKKALCATQNEFPTIALIGVWNWTKDGTAIPDMDLIQWQGHKVFLAFDSDACTKQQVRSALHYLSAELSRRGGEVLIVSLPKIGGLDKTGLDDFLVNKGRDEYVKLLDQATDYYTWDVKRIASLSGSLQDTAVKELLKLIAEESPLTQGRVGNLLKKHVNVSKRIFNEMLKQALIKSVTPEIETPSMTEQDKGKAMGILTGPELIERFLNDIKAIGCVGDEENKVALYLHFTSRKLDEPINIIIKSESSAGKSFEAKSVVQFIPKEEYMEFTSITPKALYYRKDSLAHKVLIIYERPGAEAADYSLRTLQSEKKLVISTTQKNPDTGRLEAVDIEVPGPVAYLETTTKARLHEENETRCFALFVDETQEQTAHIFEAQNDKYLGKSVDVEAIVKPWQDAQRLLKIYPVQIPFIQQIQFPDNPLRVRRDRVKFLALVEASALLHQYQREKKSINGKEYVVATIFDYALAYKLASKIMEHTVTGLSPHLKQLLEAASTLVDNKVQDEDGKPEDKIITSKELLTCLKWNRKTINKYINVGNDAGYFEITDGGKGKPYSIKVIRRFDEKPIPLLLSPSELLKRLEPVHLETGVQMGDGQVNQLNNIEKTTPVHLGTE